MAPCNACKMYSCEVKKLRDEVVDLRREMARIKALLPPDSPNTTSFQATGKKPKVETPPVVRGQWQVQRRVSSKLRLVREPKPLEIRNRFSAISNVEAKVETPDVQMIGDSMFRDQGIIFGRKSGKRATVKCFPGAGVDKICEALPKERDALQATAISVGTNNVGECTSAALRLKFRALLGRLCERRSPTLLLGILPRLGVRREWTEQAREMNRWLHTQCVSRGLTFLNMFDFFSRKPELFTRDGVHLTLRGKEILADEIEEVLGESSIYNSFLG